MPLDKFAETHCCICVHGSQTGKCTRAQVRRKLDICQDFRPREDVQTEPACPALVDFKDGVCSALKNQRESTEEVAGHLARVIEERDEAEARNATLLTQVVNAAEAEDVARDLRARLDTVLEAMRTLEDERNSLRNQVIDLEAFPKPPDNNATLLTQVVNAAEAEDAASDLQKRLAAALEAVRALKEERNATELSLLEQHAALLQSQKAEERVAKEAEDFQARLTASLSACRGLRMRVEELEAIKPPDNTARIAQLVATSTAALDNLAECLRVDPEKLKTLCGVKG